MPSVPRVVVTSDQEQSSSALQTLVANLRSRDAERTDEMIEQHPEGETDSDLVHELVTRVSGVSATLETHDAELAQLLASLLSHLHRLSVIYSTQSGGIGLGAGLITQSHSWSPVDGSPSSHDPFDALKRHLSTFQVERQASHGQNGTPAAPPGSTPVMAVESAILWSKIDEELDQVVSMCKSRTDTYSEYLPPQYMEDSPPEYDDARPSYSSIDEKHRQSTEYSASGEKMKMELEAVTLAIDRLYMVAPQLHNQRVELKSSKLEQLEKARREGSPSAQNMSPKAKGKQKEQDVKDLEKMLDLVAKASSRSYKDQSVVLDGGMQSRLEKAKRRNDAKVCLSHFN
jgi:ubiquitin-protein ligase E3 D